MVLVRRRYYFWLLKAYLKRWRKTIVLSAFFGVILFFAILFSYKSQIQPKIQRKVDKVGMWGTYKIDTLPTEILEQISVGLTKVKPNGQIAPQIALSWEIKDDGKIYTFHLKKDARFDNGDVLTAYNLPLEFEGVTKRIDDEFTISYILKAPYAPFLSTVSKPILTKNLQGLGEYKLKDIDFNLDFIKSLTLENKADPNIKKTIYFYPTEDALKTAFALGEIDSAKQILNTKFDRSDYKNWKNVTITKQTNYTKLVSLFYNTSDQNLSNKKLRQALNYAIADTFPQGVRAYASLPPDNIYFTKPPNYGIYDLELAKTLLTESSFNTKSTDLEITTTSEYEEVAKKIQSEWAKLNVQSKIKIVDGIPDDFQIFLYSFKLPKDPDQYVIWHSGQKNNIMNYKNIRIDKLLQDGRVTNNFSERLKIYADFEKYLLDDVPASFLYFPTEYIIERK